MHEHDKSVEGILVHLGYIRQSCTETAEQLKILNTRTGDLEKKVAVLEERNPSRTGGMWGSLGGAVAGFIASFMGHP